MARILHLCMLVAVLSLSGCYQVGYVAGSGVHAVRHPIDTASTIYGH